MSFRRKLGIPSKMELNKIKKKLKHVPGEKKERKDPNGQKKGKMVM